MGNLIALMLKYNPSQLLQMTIYQIPFYFYGYYIVSGSGWWILFLLFPVKHPKFTTRVQLSSIYPPQKYATIITQCNLIGPT